jgi:hypothetical protein
MSAASVGWRQDVPVAGQKVIEADPQIVDAFKNIGYSPEAAVADLVDNSVDAAASTVLIRFLHTEDDLVSLVVIDNGRGMREQDIDRAMQFGGRRHYSDTDIGMYGMGLKSASLSQAYNVTVLSKSARSTPVGRRWTEEQAKAGWKCDVIAQDFVDAELRRPWIAALNTSRHGTIIRWDHVRDFQKAKGNIPAYLRKMRLSIANHLGLQLHRFLEADRLSIVIDAENIDTREIGAQTAVEALDPFSYLMSGAPGYPKTFDISIPHAGHLEAVAHIWPARAKTAGYKLGGGAVSRRQGFYFYRSDRLIQAGRDRHPEKPGEFFQHPFQQVGSGCSPLIRERSPVSEQRRRHELCRLHRPGHRGLSREVQCHDEAHSSARAGIEIRCAEGDQE